MNEKLHAATAHLAQLTQEMMDISQADEIDPEQAWATQTAIAKAVDEAHKYIFDTPEDARTGEDWMNAMEHISRGMEIVHQAVVTNMLARAELIGGMGIHERTLIDARKLYAMAQDKASKK